MHRRKTFWWVTTNKNNKTFTSRTISITKFIAPACRINMLYSWLDKSLNCSTWLKCGRGAAKVMIIMKRTDWRHYIEHVFLRNSLSMNTVKFHFHAKKRQQWFYLIEYFYLKQLKPILCTLHLFYCILEKLRLDIITWDKGITLNNCE